MEKFREKVEAIVNVLLRKPERIYAPLPTILEQVSSEHGPEAHRRKHHLAASWKFNVVIGVLIILNSILVGFETDNDRGTRLQDRVGFFLIDFVFAVLFFAEMLVRQNQLGWDFFQDPWNVFDYALVVMNCADIVAAVNSSGIANEQVASNFRALRLLRLVRYIRGIKPVYGMWLVIQGLLDSFKTMLWTGLFLLIMTYVLAVALFTMTTSNPQVQARWPEMNIYLGDMYTSMVTVSQIVTLDGWASEIARPLIKAGAPEALSIVLLAIVVCKFGILNIIIALMVERMAHLTKETDVQNSQILEQTERSLMLALGEHLRSACVGDDGQIRLEEFKQQLELSPVLYKLKLLGVDTDEALALWDLLDADQSGSIAPEEWVAGLARIRGVARGADLLELICFTQKQTHRAKLHVSRIKALCETADTLQARLNVMGRSMSVEMSERKEASVRNNVVWKQAAERQVIIGNMDKERRVQFPSLKGPEFAFEASSTTGSFF